MKTTAATAEPRIVVRPLDLMTEGTWQFREHGPRWRHRRHGSSAIFDPFPAYPHQLLDVEKMAQHVAEACPPVYDVELFVANREEEGRSNGYSSVTQDGRYVGSEWVKDEPVGLIVLSGKRIPPHPAVTRYLVAHEYGHNVEYMLNHVRGHGTHSDETVREYAKVRGLPDEAVHHGDGGRWHDSAAEVFACDFRVLVCDVEAAFWPHPGIPYPTDLRLREWWYWALAQLAEHRTRRLTPTA